MIYFNLLIFPGQHFQDDRQKRIYRSTEELHALVNIDQYYFLYKGVGEQLKISTASQEKGEV